MSSTASVLFCECRFAQVISPEMRESVRRGLDEAGVAYETVPDLCEMAARRDPALARLAGGPVVKVAACHPRAVKWLFHQAGSPLAAERTEILNMRTLPAEEVVRGLCGETVQPNLPADARDSPRAPALEGSAPVVNRLGARTEHWKPWFPVIDYDRCTNCMQCLSFCLFGVYGVDGDKRIQVQNQDNCKTNCPACSRVCPEAAIMFPKYKAGPINGDVVSADDLEREKMKIDISSLLGGDVYDLLRQRSERAKSRFSKERDADKALAEQASDIPPEVLMSLPGPDEIMRRSAEAQAKAQAVLASL